MSGFWRKVNFADNKLSCGSFKILSDLDKDFCCVHCCTLWVLRCCENSNFPAHFKPDPDDEEQV